MFTYVYYDYDDYMGLSYDDIYDLYTFFVVISMTIHCIRIHNRQQFHSSSVAE
jgi:hypothetical protein